MAKPFKFDAIGRDLLAGERQAARAFVSKYESPPSRADAQRKMRTVMGRVLKAAAQVSASATVKAAPTVFAGQQTKVVSGKRVQGDVNSTKVPVGMNEKKVQVGMKTRSTSQLVVRGSTKRSAKG
jgi:hypothetical protein